MHWLSRITEEEGADKFGFEAIRHICIFRSLSIYIYLLLVAGDNYLLVSTIGGPLGSVPSTLEYAASQTLRVREPRGKRSRRTSGKMFPGLNRPPARTWCTHGRKDPAQPAENNDAMCQRPACVSYCVSKTNFQSKRSKPSKQGKQSKLNKHRKQSKHCK